MKRLLLLALLLSGAGSARAQNFPILLNRETTLPSVVSMFSPGYTEATAFLTVKYVTGMVNVLNDPNDPSQGSWTAYEYDNLGDICKLRVYYPAAGSSAPTQSVIVPAAAGGIRGVCEATWNGQYCTNFNEARLVICSQRVSALGVAHLHYSIIDGYIARYMPGDPGNSGQYPHYQFMSGTETIWRDEDNSGGLPPLTPWAGTSKYDPDVAGMPAWFIPTFMDLVGGIVEFTNLDASPFVAAIPVDDPYPLELECPGTRPFYFW